MESRDDESVENTLKGVEKGYSKQDGTEGISRQE
jgi:hypothetical protein